MSSLNIAEIIIPAENFIRTNKNNILGAPDAYIRKYWLFKGIYQPGNEDYAIRISLHTNCPWSDEKPKKGPIPVNAAKWEYIKID